MLIVLPKDFFQFDDNSTKFLSCLEHLLEIFQSGYHYIYSESTKSIDDYLSRNKTDKRQTFLLNELRENSRKSKAIVNTVPYYIRITSFKDKNTTYDINDGRVINTNLEFFSEQESVSPTLLLCENIKDCKIYQTYFSFFISKKYNGLKVKFNHVHGGGQTTDTLFVNRNRNINMICIKDGDAFCPQKIKQSDIEKDIAIGILYHINAYEIENILSHKIIHEIAADLSTCSDIFCIIEESYNRKLYFHQFIDFKEGIYKKHFRKMTSDFKEQFVDFLKSMHKISDSDLSCLEHKCNEHCKDCKLFNGFGDKLLDSFSHFIELKSNSEINRLLEHMDFESFFPNLLPHILGCGLASNKVRDIS